MLRLMKIRHKKYQSCDTTQTGCPVLDSVHLYTLAVVTEVILEQVYWSRADSQPYTLRSSAENFTAFPIHLEPLNSTIVDLHEVSSYKFCSLDCGGDS